MEGNMELRVNNDLKELGRDLGEPVSDNLIIYDEMAKNKDVQAKVINDSGQRQYISLLNADGFSGGDQCKSKPISMLGWKRINRLIPHNLQPTISKMGKRKKTAQNALIILNESDESVCKKLREDLHVINDRMALDGSEDLPLGLHLSLSLLGSVIANRLADWE